MSDGRTHWEGCERDRGHQECALARLDAVTADRDAYKAHYDKLSGEMDLLGLLDLYFEWTEEARSERDALAEALRGLRDALDALMGESRGVAGLHLNGDEALWSELTEGGNFEGWLGPAMSAARTALTPPRADGGGA